MDVLLDILSSGTLFPFLNWESTDKFLPSASAKYPYKSRKLKINYRVNVNLILSKRHYATKLIFYKRIC